MSRTCRRVRDRLTSGTGVTDRVERHVAGCDECRRYGARLQAVREGLAAHHAGVEPGAGFVGRVMARREGGAAETMGWAALRLLPVSLVLVLALVVLAWAGLPPADPLDEAVSVAPTEDPVAWLLEDPGDGS